MIPGTMLGPYEILTPLGQGGMGEVWKARDSRLDRTVAVKVSKAAFTDRFEREARAVAALNHPHICTLYDVGPNYLVMEFVEGSILKGPLPVEKAVEYAGQILDALDAAHRKGITHRDLKPGNIMVTKQGIKLLDFGLAKQSQGPLKEGDATVTDALTQQGQIVGTLPYMAPEQLQGKPADARSDIFAFGCVLYEILSGKRAFPGSNSASIIAGILEHEPAPLDLQLPLQRVISTCLTKDPDQRFQNAADLKRALHWAMEPQPANPQRRQILPWIAAGVLAPVSALSLWAPWRTSPKAEGPFLQFDLDAGSSTAAQPAISRDGLRIVFVSNGSLAMRRLDEGKITPLGSTEGAQLPFFSPDGRWVAFFAHGKLQKIALDGGAPVTLCDTVTVGGGAWGDDDQIVASINADRGLSRIAASGGTPQPLTDSKADAAEQSIHQWPQVLPGGKGILFGAANGSAQGSVRVLTPNGQETLVENSAHGRYLAGGYLVYHQRGTLFAAPMDLDRLALTGPAVPVVEAVSYSQWRADFDVSSAGTLVYHRGAAPNVTLAWVSAAGKIEPLPAKPGQYSQPRLSPDGRRLALSVLEQGKQNIWVYDLNRDAFTRLTFADDPDLLPRWTPDGEFLAIRSGTTLSWLRSDGSGKLERLTGVSRNSGPSDFSRDGKWLTFWPLGPGSHLYIVPVERSPGSLRLGQPRPLVEQRGSKGAPVISPDGRWLAYTSDESGRFEVYVIPFAPDGASQGGKWQVSNEGGSGPIWSPNGRQIFYPRFDQRIEVAAYTSRGDSFQVEKPRFWSEVRFANQGMFAGFDVSSDGKRVLMLLPGEEAKPEPFLRVLLNVGTKLRRRAQPSVK